MAGNSLPLQTHMLRRANAGDYDQPSALERLKRKAAAGDLDAEARVRMLESIESRLEQ